MNDTLNDAAHEHVRVMRNLGYGNLEVSIEGGNVTVRGDPPAGPSAISQALTFYPDGGLIVVTKSGDTGRETTEVKRWRV